jgi:hypothetical protein
VEVTRPNAFQCLVTSTARKQSVSENVFAPTENLAPLLRRFRARLCDVTNYPKITLALLKRGLSEEDIAKIWGGNTLRVLRAAEEFAMKASVETKAP